MLLRFALFQFSLLSPGECSCFSLCLICVASTFSHLLTRSLIKVSQCSLGFPSFSPEDYCTIISRLSVCSLYMYKWMYIIWKRWWIIKEENYPALIDVRKRMLDKYIFSLCLQFLTQNSQIPLTVLCDRSVFYSKETLSKAWLEGLAQISWERRGLKSELTALS